MIPPPFSPLADCFTSSCLGQHPVNSPSEKIEIWDFMRYTIILSAWLLCSACNETSLPTAAVAATQAPAPAQAGTPVLPEVKEATQALLEMLDMKELQNAEAKLGTCIP